MKSLLEDLVRALRSLARRPAIPLFAVLTLGLGVGATASIYGVAYSVLLRPLPYPEANRLVEIEGAFGFAADGLVVADYVRELGAFEGTALYTPGGGANVGDENPVRARATLVGADFLPTLGVEPALGRGFVDDDEAGGNVAVVSHGFWRTHLSGAEGAVGETLLVQGRPTTVVGVMPPRVGFPEGTELWLPPSRTDVLGQASVPTVLARLRPDVSFERAEAMILTARREIDPGAERATGPQLESIGERLRAPARRPLAILTGAALLVLMIACANVTGLLVARAVDHRRDLAIRSALGASRWRLARQVLVEGMLLGTGAVLVGVAFAAWSGVALQGLLPDGVAPPGIWPTFAPALVAAVLAGIVAALVASAVPALRSASVPGRLATGDGSGAGPDRQRFRNALTAGEVALAVVLLTGAGLFLRSSVNLQNVDLGFRPAGAVAADLHLPSASYSTEQIEAFVTELEGRLSALPGVEAAVVADHVPLGERMGIGARAAPADAAVDEAGELPSGAVRAVTPGYFTAIGAELVSGRSFRSEDGAGPPVFIVSDVLAEQLWGGESAVGRRVKVHMGEPVEGEVLGVVRTVRARGPDTDPTPEIYRPFEHGPTYMLSLVVRSAGEPVTLVPALRREVAEIDPELPLFNVRTMTDAVAGAVADRRAATLLFTLFASVAVVLAGTGLYGVLAYLVTRRTREIGVRMAMGARAIDIARLVFGRAGGLVLAGAVAGTLAAWAGGRVIDALLFEVSSRDPLVLFGAPAVLVVLALAAALIPVRRAARIDPMEALRHE